MNAVIEREDAMIDEFGFAYTLVFGGDSSPGFVYTSGLAEKGLPEFIFVGSSEARSHGYLTEFVKHVMVGGALPIGRYQVGSPPNPFRVPAWVVEADDKLETHAFGVASRLRRIGSDVKPRLLQIVMPDLVGRFPWEPGYEWMNQMVYEEPQTTD